LLTPTVFLTRRESRIWGTAESRQGARRKVQLGIEKVKIPQMPKSARAQLLYRIMVFAYNPCISSCIF
jgi:hypothetical protein